MKPKSRRFWDTHRGLKVRLRYPLSAQWDGRTGTAVGCSRGDRAPGDPYVDVWVSTMPDGSPVKPFLWQPPSSMLEVIGEDVKMSRYDVTVAVASKGYRKTFSVEAEREGQAKTRAAMAAMADGLRLSGAAVEYEVVKA